MIPALAFNDGRPTQVVDGRSPQRERRRMFVDQYNIKSLVDSASFFYKASHLKVRALEISAISHTPLHAEKRRDGSSYLLIPTAGIVEGETRKEKYRFATNETAFLSSNDTKFFKTSARAVVRIKLNMDEINSAFSAMAGSWNGGSLSTNSRPVRLNAGEMNLSNFFMNLFQQIELAAGNEKILTRLGLDDSVHRLCAYLLEPDRFSTELPPGAAHGNIRVEITRLCEFLRAHLCDPISLTEMEKTSGLSARVLQYSFQQAYGMRPREWLRKQRLHAVRDAIQNPTAEIKITSLSYDYCFASPSDLARQYRREFGELPSETIRKYRAQISHLFCF